MDILSNRCRKNLLSSQMPAVQPYLQAELAGQNASLHTVPEGTLTRVEKKAGERKVVCAHLPTYRVGQCPPLLKRKTVYFGDFFKKYGTFWHPPFGWHPVGCFPGLGGHHRGISLVFLAFFQGSHILKDNITHPRAASITGAALKLFMEDIAY